MKTSIFKISAFILLLALVGAGCEKDDEQILEISPASKTAVIQKEVDGIEFKFCLLNEKGEPATVFKEGENFSFLFAMTNKSGKKLYLDNRFLDGDFVMYIILKEKILRNRMNSFLCLTLVKLQCLLLLIILTL